jgi:hypothetical protein
VSTLREIVYSILDVIKPNNLTSSSINEELVKQYVKVVRAQLIKQLLSKNTSLDSVFIQSLGCVPLVKTDKSECCDYPVGCKVLRTSVPIPSAVDGATNLITRVGPVSMFEKSYQNIQAERVPFIGKNKYTKGIIKWFNINTIGYIYLVTDESLQSLGLETVNIQGVFEDPEEVGNFRNCTTGTSCFNVDSQYPFPESMLPTLKEMVMKKFLIIESAQPIDKTNDANENSKPQT